MKRIDDQSANIGNHLRTSEFACIFCARDCLNLKKGRKKVTYTHYTQENTHTHDRKNATKRMLRRRGDVISGTEPLPFDSINTD